MNKDLEAYLKLIKSIYRDDVVNFLTTINEDGKIFLKCFKNKLSEFFTYRRKDNFCALCEEKGLIEERTLKRTTMYRNKIIEFPCWHTEHPLDFTKSHVKSFMIIGIDPGPSIRSDIHAAYELNMFSLNQDQTNDVNEFSRVIGLEKFSQFKKQLLEHYTSSKGAGLFPYLKDLFLDKYDYLLKNLYITDISKCFLDYEGIKRTEKSRILRICFSEYLKREIILINPKLIIFQGTSFEIFKSITRDHKDILIENEEQIVNKYFNNVQDLGIRNRKFGTIWFNSNKAKFIKLYHSSSHNIPSKMRMISLNSYRELIQDELIYLF